ncbi:MAG: DNA repair protein RadC [Melioribacteraceae bacterium]|jgi:DNA repair protein RadC|nr:DNA repair protein RadC [Melioribacteraceae bacterium]RJP59206.1 MAG: JAB domain-containing protein [Ignavibacteriales bacterium]WKZ70574.1 MAG: DNA repair protein RadC [Melioribacteraceae bacterium]
MKVKDLPLDDRPREKLILRGAQNLSDAELLAILLRTGSKNESVIVVAQKLLKEFGNVSVLASKSVEELTQIKGIGKDKAAALVAAFELVRRIEFESKWYSNKKITSPKEIAELYIPLLRDELQEKFYVVCLSSSNRIIKHELLFVGTLNASLVAPREIFKTALANNSANIILMHNHPSGNPEPSQEDISITRKISEAGKVLEIQIFDHIIIAGNSYISFVEKRIL